MFKSSYRKLLVGIFNKNNSGNCMILDKTSVLSLSPRTEFIQERFEVGDDNSSSWIDLHAEGLEDQSEYRENVIVYIAGFIQRIIMRKENCMSCSVFLRSSNVTSDFLEVRDRGGLVRSSKDVAKVVRKADTVLNHLIKTGDIRSNILQKMSVIVIQDFVASDPNLFKLVDHIEEEINNGLKHYSRLQNNKNDKTRKN